MRENLDYFFMKVAFMYSTRSTCLRRQVGCVIVKDKSQIAAGYNGALAGEPHCIDHPEQCIRNQLHIPSGEKSELCLTGDNQIRLRNNSRLSLKELVERNDNACLYSIDEHTGEVITGQVLNACLTGYRDDIVKVTFDKGVIKCTSDHLIMTHDRKYKMAKHLMNCHCMAISFDSNQTYTSKVISIESIKGTFPVYDLTVPISNNFAVDVGNIGIIVHNCVAAHSELSAIAQAAKNGICLDGATIYVTHKPCVNCTKAIIASGIKRVVYCHEYGSKADNAIADELLKKIQVSVLEEKYFNNFTKNLRGE